MLIPPVRYQPGSLAIESRAHSQLKNHNSATAAAAASHLPPSLPKKMSNNLHNNKAKIILDAAASGNYAIPAICVYNMEGILATVAACEARRSPGMILLFPWAQEYSSLALAALASHCAKAAKVPITVHLDHAQSASAVKLAADSGFFDSIMVDMSHYDHVENLARTKELTRYCHERGIVVEAEPGRIEGGEDGVGDTGELEAMMTDEGEAREFVGTGIDWLAPAFGNVHGNYGARGIRLDYERLGRLRDAVGKEVRLVLHGTDGFDEEILGRCLEGGVVKVNVNRVVNRRWSEAVGGEGTMTAVIERATRDMQKEVEWWCRALRSEGRARIETKY